MKAKEGFVLRTIVDEYMLMPTGANITRFDGTVVLNEVSAFLWNRLQQDTDRDALLAALLEEYDVPREVARQDLDALLLKFTDLGLIEL